MDDCPHLGCSDRVHPMTLEQIREMLPPSSVASRSMLKGLFAQGAITSMPGWTQEEAKDEGTSGNIEGTEEAEHGLQR